MPGTAESAAAALGGREILDNFETHLDHGHDHHLRDAIAGVDGELPRCRDSRPTPSAVPDSRSRSSRPDCRAQCRSYGPGPIAAAAWRRSRVRRCKSKCRWESVRLPPGFSTSGASMQARRSMPAEPEVACCGSGNSRADARIQDPQLDGVAWRRPYRRARRPRTRSRGSGGGGSALARAAPRAAIGRRQALGDRAR